MFDLIAGQRLIIVMMDEPSNPNDSVSDDTDDAYINLEKEYRAAEIRDDYKAIARQVEESGRLAAGLAAANIELAFRNEVNEKRLHALSEAYTEVKNTLADIRNRYAALEQNVIRRSAQYSFLSQVNQTIIQVKDADTLFQKACSLGVEYGKFKMAWVGRFDVDARQITVLNYCGIPDKDVVLFKDAPFEENGPLDHVLQSGNYFLSNDIENEVKSKKWKSYAGLNDIHSCIVLPVKNGDKIYGTFTLCASEKNFFLQEDIDLLLQVTGDISFALEHLEKAELNRKAEEIKKINEKRFRALIEKSSDMETLFSVEGKMIYGSPSISKILGYSHEEYLNITVTDLVHPDDLEVVMKKIQGIAETPLGSFYSQHRLKHKNGYYIWCEGTATNMIHEPYVNGLVANFRDITDKKTIEQRQEFESNNLTALINSTNDLMWSVDKNYNLITSNKSFDDMVKVLSSGTIESSVGKNVIELGFSEEQSNRYKNYYDRAFAGEAFTVHEYLDNPVEYWTEISFNPIRKGNEIIGTACHSHDITDIRKGERHIKESESFIRGILDSLNSHIAVIDDKGEIVAVNESWKQFALDNGETHLLRTGTGCNYYKVCEIAALNGDETALMALNGLQDVMNGRIKSFCLEYPCDTPMVQRWFGMRVLKFESDIPMVVVAHLDITERKLAEERSLKSEARLKEAQALAKVGNWETELSSYEVIWSEETFRIFEIERVEFGCSHIDFMKYVHPEDRDYVESAFRDSLTNNMINCIEHRIITTSGKVKTVEERWHITYDINSAPKCAIGTCQDITERKAAEKEREQLTNDLIQRNRDLEQFAFIISHNLRAPIANVIGFTEFLQDEPAASPQYPGLLQGLSTSVAGLDRVIKDISLILQVRRDVNEKKELILFSQLVDAIIISINNLIDKQNVTIDTDFSEVDEIFSLKVYMHSVFYNLISNSIKYRKPAEALRIEIKSKIENGRIVLKFKDNGLGFDMKTKGDKVFGLYKRYHSHVEGRGMGLFMVKTQVQAMNGEITVSSELNVGTQFTIQF